MSADFLAGLVGGAAGVVCGHPADTVKVVQQAGKRARISEFTGWQLVYVTEP